MISKIFILFTLCSLSLAFVVPYSYETPSLMNQEDQDTEVHYSLPLSSVVSDKYRDSVVPIYDDDLFIPVQEHSRYRRHAQQNQNEGQQKSVSVGVGRTSRGGTDLNAEATARLWQSPDKRSSVDSNAFYQRHYGGQMGTTRPNYGGGITFTHRF